MPGSLFQLIYTEMHREPVGTPWSQILQSYIADRDRFVGDYSQARRSSEIN